MTRGVKGAGVCIRVEDVDLMSFSGITVEQVLEKWGGGLCLRAKLLTRQLPPYFILVHASKTPTAIEIVTVQC